MKFWRFSFLNDTNKRWKFHQILSWYPRDHWHRMQVMRLLWKKGVTDGHMDPQTDGWTKLNSNICESLFPVVKRSFHTFRCTSSFHSKKRKIWNKYLYIISYIFYLISFFVFSLNINSICQSHMITNIPSYHGKRLITSEERATR